MFLSSSRDKFTLLKQNSVTDVSVGFRPPCWRASECFPAWCLHTNLGKMFLHIHVSCSRKLLWLNLGEGLCISTFFLFPDSRLDLLNGFDFYFLYLATNNKPKLGQANS